MKRTSLSSLFVLLLATAQEFATAAVNPFGGVNWSTGCQRCVDTAFSSCGGSSATSSQMLTCLCTTGGINLESCVARSPCMGASYIDAGLISATHIDLCADFNPNSSGSSGSGSGSKSGSSTSRSSTTSRSSYSYSSTYSSSYYTTTASSSTTTGSSSLATSSSTSSSTSRSTSASGASATASTGSGTSSSGGVAAAGLASDHLLGLVLAVGGAMVGAVL